MSTKSHKKKKREVLLLLDGNAIIHRAFHALPPLTSPDGTQTNAAYGFTSTLLNVLEKFQPEYVIATFDLPGKNFRHAMFSEYKATRKKTPDDLIPQFAIVKEVVRAMNIMIVEKKGVEADDVIGTLAKNASNNGVDVIIVTGDKDTLQLVDERVRVFTMSRGIQDMLLYDEVLVKEKMGITPDQVIEYKGLRGDSSDNIPGVKGIGDKGAVDLLSHFGTLDGVYANIDDARIKEGVRKKLKVEKERAYLSRELGIIKCDLDIVLDLDNAKSEAISFVGAFRIFQKYGFKSLLKRLPKESVQQDDPAPVEYICMTPQEAITLYRNKEVVLACDHEGSILYGIALTTETITRYIAFEKRTKNDFVRLLACSDIKFVTYDVKEVLHIFAYSDLPETDFVMDVHLQAYVLRTGSKIEFAQIIFDILGRDVQAHAERTQLILALRDEAHAREHTIVRAQDTLSLYKYFVQEIDTVAATQNKRHNIKTLLYDVEMPVANVLFHMERSGIGFDAGIFAKKAKNTNASLTKLTYDIHTLADKEFNINSTQQLREVLFEELALPTTGIKKTKTGYSTAANELAKLREKHPIIVKIEMYRELFKLKTTYIDALPLLVGSDGRIHSTFNQTVTATGRLSSSNPNLQNIPIRSEAGRALREGFVAQKENALISADYSQIELRCVAHVARDKEMIKAFCNGADIHTFTAASVLGKELLDVTKIERSSAKELNFGLIYGMGVRSFARSAELSMEEAKAFVDAYFEKFHGIKKYMKKTKEDAHKKGYVETALGRRKYTPELQSANAMLRAAGERAAINMPIQGLAADIMKLAMIAVQTYITRKFPQGDVRMVLQVHDEIILEVPEKNAGAIAQAMKEIMEQVYTLDVPLLVDVSMGKHWGEL